MAEFQGPSTDPANEERQSRALEPGEIVLGTLRKIDGQGCPLVDFPNNPSGEPLVAIATVAVDHSHLGRQVALLFAQGDYRQPIIAGFIQSPLYAILDRYQEPEGLASSSGPEAAETEDPHKADSAVARVDGETVTIEGKKEVVLKCGDASITLTRAGKILIRGKYLQSRSSGVNRILGGSVQVN